MNNKIVTTIVLVSVAAAVGGIAVGVKATHEKNAALEEARALRAMLKASDALTNAPVESLPLVALKDISEVNTNDLAELKAQLAVRDAELERLRADMEHRNNRVSRPSFKERMAQLKEEDPERYAEMIRQSNERQEQMRYDQASRLALFTEIDTSGMSEEELANHNRLMERLTALWEVTDAFDPENPPDWSMFREAIGDFRELGRMMDKERTYMFKQLGAEVGLSGTDSDDFAAYVQEIVEITSLRPPRGMRGGGQSRGPGGAQ